ncbi:saccharopine dehydrogenase NADP-binding domain-containing protein [Pararhodobacter zhoushanensis]|uniref:Saccharopine dehydrogenase NADP binding domain-containing protein n=1 Tax=Pararhodobacter zhoushanensis TaxID=2479545 RepID=A0ABT3GX41_9RHOB|nr:saccharopine dehydrogenase NADP-binding domain-containing protein [Pararhodobacter zhoushanensis]MCW1932108.1 hypothetical protein [Pararhodobacter zhoushanensis]
MKPITIVGGYGHVGSKIARRLSGAGLPVRIAGRDVVRAKALADQLGTDAARLDLDDATSWDAALQGSGPVVVCLDTATTQFASAVLTRGLGYVDISATDAVLQRHESLDALARSHGALAVLSVGLAPGLTNLMALEALRGLDRIESLTIGVLLGLGDSHGAAAIDWTLDSLRPLPPDAVQRLDFASGPVPTIPFDFADQHVLTRAGIPAVTTRLGLGSPLVTGASLRLLSALAPRPMMRKLLRWSLPRFRLGSDRTGLVIIADGWRDGARVTRRLTLDGRAEAEITALVAARVARDMATRTETGVHHIQTLWQLADLAPDLAAEGITLSA